MARRSSAAPTEVPTVPSPRGFRFHQVLRGARYAHGIERQGELAALIGVSKFRVWELETARVRPTEDELARLRAALPLLERFMRLARLREVRDDVEIVGRL